MGDIAGVGPEIIAKTMTRPEILELADVVVIGDAAAMLQGIRDVDAQATVNRIDDLPQAEFRPGVIDLIQPTAPLEVPRGQVSAVAGDGAVQFVKKACALARDGYVDGIVTAPLNKEAMHLGGHDYPGHTELLASEFGVDRFSLVLASEKLAVFHVTAHVALREAVDLVTAERTLETIRLASRFARAAGDGSPRIGVAGLNPHAGENGIFGQEDLTRIKPAIEAARAEGIDAYGPLPADALLPQAVNGDWNWVVVTYHDQGHAPFKSVYGDNGVNITAGLPTVRVSVDHGTAFDIAGTGVARDDSLALAVRRAAELAPGWKAAWELD